MFWKKHILTKLLLGIMLPVALVMVLTSVFILRQVESSVTEVTKNELKAQSEAASNQVENFFTKYEAIAAQITNSPSFAAMLREIDQPGSAKQAESFPAVVQYFDNILQSDANIALVWSADFDSGESIRSGGVVKGLPDYDITTREWYLQMQKKKAPFILTTTDSTTGELVSNVLAPQYEGSTLVGCAGVDITVEQISQIMAGYKLGTSGFFVLVDEAGTVVYHPDANAIGKPASESPMSQDVISAIEGNSPGFYIYENSGTECQGYLQPVGDTGWQVLTGLPTGEFYASYYAIRSTIYLIFGAGLGLIVLTILLIASGIVRPVRRLAAAAGKIAEGELDVTIDSQSVDETGMVAKSLAQTVDRLKKYILYIDEISSVIRQIGDGRLDFTLEQDYAGEFAKVRDALGHLEQTLTSTMRNIRQSADQVASGSDQVSAGAQALSQGATEQASSVEELAATINEISGQVQSNAQNAHQASEVAGDVGARMTESNEKMQDMIKAMGEISNSSSEIGKIIKTIEDIAFQTNILALNAAVEAARAGVAGKGFAVVADEVRNLANKSQEASKNTSALIEGSIHSVEKGTQIADQTAQALLSAVEGAKDVIQLVGKISSASEEQALSIAQVTQGVDQISSVVQTNSATAEESAAASEELSGQAQMLKSLVGQFQLKEAAGEQGMQMDELYPASTGARRGYRG